MPGGEPLRLLFFGTPEFAVASLEALVTSRHAVVGVISQPDRPRGRGRALTATPVAALAARHEIPVFQPAKVGDTTAVEWMRQFEPDLGCVVAFGQFIPKCVREAPREGLINAHASLLPRYRGAAPIAWAILEGEVRTGVTIIRVEREMDAGDWCLMRETNIDPEETAGQLSERLARLAAEALLEAVERIAAGEAEFRAQEHAKATLAPRLERSFGRLDWSEPATHVLCRIRAATPWPGADVRLRRSGRSFRILRALPGSRGVTPTRPGLVRAEEGRLRIAALDGWVDVLRLQAPGRRPVAAAEYLRGARVPEDEEIEDT